MSTVSPALLPLSFARRASRQEKTFAAQVSAAKGLKHFVNGSPDKGNHPDAGSFQHAFYHPRQGAADEYLSAQFLDFQDVLDCTGATPGLFSIIRSSSAESKTVETRLPQTVKAIFMGRTSARHHTDSVPEDCGSD
jgi:hypothetical protein